MSSKYQREKQKKQQKGSASQTPKPQIPPQQQLPPQQQPPPQPTSINLKPTDITISKSLESVFPDKVALFNRLKAKERELDLMINKKIIDLQDYQQTLNNGLIEQGEDDEILRIFIYNTSENQPWQIDPNLAGATTPPPPPPPSWTLRVEGRLLGDAEPLDSPTRRKFSSFLSGISVELKAKDGNQEDLKILAVNAGSSSRIIEWHDTFETNEIERQKQQFDGLDIKRGGSSILTEDIPEGEYVEADEREIIAEIVIQPKMFPIKLQIMKDSLIELTGCNEITQPDCIHKIFNYIKMNNLFEVQNIQQQATDGKTSGPPQQIVSVKTDDLLYRIFETNSLTLSQIMEIVSTKLLKPVEPIRLTYSINTLKNTTLGDVIIDLRVNSKLIDPKFKPGEDQLASINELLNETLLNKTIIDDFNKLNENLGLNLQLLNYSKMKYDFYKKLSEDPAGFLQKSLDKNNEFLKILSSDSVSFGNDGLIDEELVRRSEFYSDEFLSEHIGTLFNSARI